MGKLVYRACEDLKQRVGAVDSDADGLTKAIAAWHAAHPGEELLGRAKYEKPTDVQWDDKLYKGDAYASYGWAAHTAEVEIDLRTFGIRVTDYVALQEIGRVLNPTLARGQIQGGVAQGLGWALMEGYDYRPRASLLPVTEPIGRPAAPASDPAAEPAGEPAAEPAN